jgi:hypothetical protein
MSAHLYKEIKYFYKFTFSAIWILCISKAQIHQFSSNIFKLILDQPLSPRIKIHPSDIFCEDKMGEACSMYRTNEKCIQILVRKPEVGRPFGRTRHGKEDSKMNHKEIKCKGVDWIHMLQNMAQFWVLVNYQALYNLGNLLIAEQLLAFNKDYAYGVI